MTNEYPEKKLFANICIGRYDTTRLHSADRDGYEAVFS